MEMESSCGPFSGRRGKGGNTMEERMFKLISRKGNVVLKVIPGHFATSNSHVNYYLDMTTGFFFSAE